MTAISTALPTDCRNGSDLTGTKCNWLTVIGRADPPADAPKSVRGTYWLCRCACGREIVLPRQYIVRKQTKDCGCRGKHRKPRQIKTEVSSGVCRELAKEMTCRGCKKKFDRLSKEWRYQALINGKRRYFCSWRCFRKAVYDEDGFRKSGT